MKKVTSPKVSLKSFSIAMHLKSLIVADHKLGSGGFGTAFICQLDSIKIAAKKPSLSEKEFRTLLIGALRLMRLQREKHTACTCGSSLKEETLCTDREYSEHGDPKNYPKINKESVIYKQGILFCHGILLDLLYYHSMEISHGDTKCPNVTLGKNLDPQLTNFGLSIEIDSIEDYCKASEEKIHWTAPELRFMEDKHNFDEFNANPYPTYVYSLGVAFCQVSFDMATEFIDSDDTKMTVLLKFISPTPRDVFLKEMVNRGYQFEHNERGLLDNRLATLGAITGTLLPVPVVNDELLRIQQDIKTNSKPELPPSFIPHRSAENLTVAPSNLSLLQNHSSNDCTDAMGYRTQLHERNQDQIKGLHEISEPCKSLKVTDSLQNLVQNSEPSRQILSDPIDSRPQQSVEMLFNAGANANAKNPFGRTLQTHRMSELQESSPQSLENEGADEAAKDAGPSAFVHHTGSIETAGSNSGYSASASIKHGSTVNVKEVMSLAKEISTAVGTVCGEYQQAQRCKEECQILAENIMEIHKLVKRLYATLGRKRDKIREVKESLKKFLIIAHDAQDIINKHSHVGSSEEVFLSNEFEDEFNRINKQLKDIKEAFNFTMEVKIPREITKPTTGMSSTNPIAVEANNNVGNTVKKAKEGIVTVNKGTRKTKDSKLLEIPTIKDNEITLYEQPGQTNRISGVRNNLQHIELIYSKEIVEDRHKLEIMRKLSSCEGILTLYGLCKYKDRLYMVTERTNQDCPTLDLMIERRTFFRNWGVICSISLHLANAIDFIHRCGILHRAICSSNVCIVEDQHVRIAGFEHAREKAFTAGTYKPEAEQIRWTAPEMLVKSIPEYDERCDIYSLGAVILSLATHEVPFSNVDLREIPRKVLIISETIPKEFAIIIEGCTDRDREKRWPIEKIIEELSELVPENLEDCIK